MNDPIKPEALHPDLAKRAEEGLTKMFEGQTLPPKVPKGCMIIDDPIKPGMDWESKEPDQIVNDINTAFNEIHGNLKATGKLTGGYTPMSEVLKKHTTIDNPAPSELTSNDDPAPSGHPSNVPNHHHMPNSKHRNSSQRMIFANMNFDEPVKP